MLQFNHRAVLGYEDDKTVKFIQSGPGGLDEILPLLSDEGIFYIVLSLEVKDQDEVISLHLLLSALPSPLPQLSLSRAARFSRPTRRFSSPGWAPSVSPWSKPSPLSTVFLSTNTFW